MNEKKTSHLLITRFFPFQLQNYERDTGDPAFLSEQAQIFKSNLLASLSNQTNKSTRLAIVVNGENYRGDEKTAAIIDGLRDSSPVETTVIPCGFSDVENGFTCDETYQSFLNNAESECDYLIETRADFDDFFYSDAVQRVVDLASENLSGITAHGYCRGITFVSDSEMYGFDFFTDRQQRPGVWSVFASLIINCGDMAGKSFTSIYNFNHGKIGADLKQYGVENDVETHYIQDPLDDAFIYVRHDAAMSIHGAGEVTIPDYAKVTQFDPDQCAKFMNEVFPARFGLKAPVS